MSSIILPAGTEIIVPESYNITIIRKADASKSPKAAETPKVPSPKAAAGAGVPKAAETPKVPSPKAAESPKVPSPKAPSPPKVATSSKVSASSIIPEFIKSLKVGDSIVYGKSSGYMGNGGNSRNIGYIVHGQVLKVLAGYKYEVTPQYAGNKPPVFILREDKSWLRDIGSEAYGYQVYSIKDHNPPKELSSEARAYLISVANAKREKNAIKKERDWESHTKPELIQIIDDHFSKEGKKMTGLRSAIKSRLIQIIKQYGIL